MTNTPVTKVLECAFLVYGASMCARKMQGLNSQYFFKQLAFCGGLFFLSLNANVLEQEARNAERAEKEKIAAMQVESERVMNDIWNKPLFSERKHSQMDPLEDGGIDDMSGDVFAVKTVPPLVFSDARLPHASVMNEEAPSKIPKKLHEVAVRGIAPELWGYVGCRDRQCFLQVQGDDLPAYSFIGTEGSANIVQVSHRKMQHGWLFVLDFPLPVKFKAVEKTKNALFLRVKERRIMETKDTKNPAKIDSLSIQEVTKSRSVITVRMQPGRTLDVRHDEKEVLLVMPPEADLARHTLMCTGDAVRGCYVENAKPSPILHIMLAHGVVVSSTWAEKDEKSGVNIYKIALKYPKEPSVLEQGHEIPLLHDSINEELASEKPEEGLPVDESEEDDYNVWSVSDDVDVASDEVRVAQTSEDMLGDGGVMAPEWLREAKRAYQEIRVVDEG